MIAWGEQQGLGLSWGAGLVLLAAIQLSLYSVLQKPLLLRYRPVEVATYAIWAGTPCCYRLHSAFQQLS